VVAAGVGVPDEGIAEEAARADLPPSRMSCFFILLYKVGR
jgi:hypothetical protein